MNGWTAKWKYILKNIAAHGASGKKKNLSRKGNKVQNEYGYIDIADRLIDR